MHTPVTRARAYLKIKQRRIDWLQDNGPCSQCGSWDNLEVDHIDPCAKVAHRIWSWSPERRDIELAKCQPLCSACHDKKTYGPTRAARKHGTVNMYLRGCRCNLCRHAANEKSRRYRASKKNIQHTT